MGIFIYLEVDKSVTKKEWRKVYQETLKLVHAFPLAEKRKVRCRGIDVICLVPTAEHEEIYGWNDEKVRIGWTAVGDYETMCTAEDYYLPRDLVDDTVEPDIVDAMMGALPAYMDYDAKNPVFDHFYSLWGGKTQGEPYHMYILAIACLIEARLGKKAFVYGDITRGQCRKAVDMANVYLKKPIDIPDRCDMERLFKRVSDLPISAREKMAVFQEFYLGKRDADFGEYLRQNFTESVCEEYWRERFEHFSVGTGGFNSLINQYLLWGFGLKKLCSLVRYDDKEGNYHYKEFVVRIMDAKLHLSDKNCADALEIDQEEEQPYSVATLFAQFLFAGARNKKIDRYIPIEEIKEALNAELADKCDVNQIIHEYLVKEERQGPVRVLQEDNMSDEEMENEWEKDAAEAFRQLMDQKREELCEKHEKYDIVDYEQLMYYKEGDTMPLGIMKSLGGAYSFYTRMRGEELYSRLMKKSAKERCRWLSEHNRSFLIRDKDWERIFNDIEKQEESFGRYYPMMRVQLNSDALVHMVTAMTLNDVLYEYCEKLADIYINERAE